VDVLFRSVAEEFGPQATAVLMTGMGEDGAFGLGEIQAAGGFTVAQSQETCVVYGMPKAAIERGFAARIADLQELPHLLQERCLQDRSRSEKPRGPATAKKWTSAGSD
jgi:two-component system, chemotaxis family, protein-glutamate methylesterase/glutaminase